MSEQAGGWYLPRQQEACPGRVCVGSWREGATSDSGQGRTPNREHRSPDSWHRGRLLLIKQRGRSRTRIDG